MSPDRPWATALDMQYLAASESARLVRELQAEGATWGALQHGNRALARADFDAIWTLTRKLRGATTYAWAPEITEAVAMAAGSVPEDMALTAETLPDASVWWWLGETAWTTPFDRQPTPVCALQVFRALDGPHRGQAGAQVLVWVHRAAPPGRGVRLSPTSTCFWYDGETLAALRARLAASAECPESLRVDLARFAPFVLAACAWLRQRVLVTDARPVERHLRRRLVREYQLASEPEVRVVQLRRREHPAPAGAASHDVDWSCRWVVTGHWRHQAYQRGARHDLKWIDPYVKGPDDKPLRMPRRTVYDVSR